MSLFCFHLKNCYNTSALNTTKLCLAPNRGKTMKANMSTTNRVIRALIGLAIIGAGIYYKNWFGALGVLPILSSAIGYCPLCCGGKSCEMKKEEKHEHKHGEGCCHH